MHPLTQDVYYQIEGGGVFVSHDFGNTRSPLGVNQGWELLIDPTDLNRFFSGASNGSGVRLSMNTGQSFRLIGPPNLSGPGVFHVALNRSGTKLYVSFNGSSNGVYVTDLSAILGAPNPPASLVVIER